MGRQRKRIGDKATALLADQRRERIESVIKLYLKGKSVMEIAKAYGLDRQAIYRDLRVARKIWHKRNDRAADALIAEEVAKLDRIESELWDQWERSKEDQTQRYSERDGTGGVTKKGKRVKGQCGDPRYMQLAMQCVDKRCRLMKIGEYSTEETGVMTAKLIEVVVENPEQVAAMMNYADYETLTAPSKN
ncbi:MAG: helix-turn-helix domain-containing protein [Pirellulaceae bacterium]|nr:helix-turn-helix domain-containing protein [Pirellulaceae bacterium]